MYRRTNPMFLIEVALVSLVSSAAVSGQEQAKTEKSNREAGDKYAINREELRRDPKAGLERVSALIEQATAEKGPDRVLAILQVEKAWLMYACADDPQEFESVLDILDPLVAEPSALLQDVEAANSYCFAIMIFTDLIGGEVVTASKIDTIARAMEEVNAAMGLSEREQFLIVSKLRLVAKDIFISLDDYAEAIKWLQPILEKCQWLAEDDQGAIVLYQAAADQAMFFAVLEKWDQCVDSAQSAAKALRESNGLTESTRLTCIARLLARQLMNFAKNTSDARGEAAWMEARNHQSLLDQFNGDDWEAVVESGLVIDEMAVSFWGERDLDQSIEILDHTYTQFENYPTLATRSSPTSRAWDIWRRVRSQLRAANESREPDIAKRYSQFLDMLESNGAKKQVISRLRD